jgi:hypothetical protein
MNNNLDFLKLKSLLEGKTVLKVLPPNASECICVIETSDNIAFRLHATDLGYWIEETSTSDGIYKNIESFLKDCSNHYFELGNDFSQEVPTPILTEQSGVHTLIFNDGREFKLKPFGKEAKFLSTDEGKIKLIEDVIGSFWLKEFNNLGLGEKSDV